MGTHPHIFTYLKVRVIESIDDIPSQHEEFTPLNEQTVEEAESEEELLVLVVTFTARK